MDGVEKQGRKSEKSDENKSCQSHFRLHSVDVVFLGAEFQSDVNLRPR